MTGEQKNAPPVGTKVLLAPQPLTMDRLEERQELIVAQSTSQCCRTGCCQPSINWLIAEGNNYEPGTNPFVSSCCLFVCLFVCLFSPEEQIRPRQEFVKTNNKL